MYFFFLFFLRPPIFLFFFFNDTATTEIYTLSLHDALPILPSCLDRDTRRTPDALLADRAGLAGSLRPDRAAACGHVAVPLERTGRPHPLASRKGGELSGGECQSRVAGRRTALRARGDDRGIGVAAIRNGVRRLGAGPGQCD